MADALDRLIDALIQKESRGDDNAVGDGGKAFGCLQIHEDVVKDVNEAYGTNYDHADAFDRAAARDMCRKYLIKWGIHYRKKTGRRMTNQVLARMWNGGGPKGWKKKATVSYWLEVRPLIQVVS